MDPIFSEIFPLSGGSDPPVPMEGLQELGTPPFLTKTFEIVDDPNTNHIVSWNKGGTSFVVWDPYTFSTILLPKYFKHNNFSSFVRQLNTYGFRKIETERWEFMNEGFLMGQRHLLKTIKRRVSSSSSSSSFSSSSLLLSHEPSGEVGEIEQLRRDKHMLVAEVSELKEQEQRARGYIQAMEQRIEGAEKKQRHMMSFLNHALQNPSVLQQMIGQRDSRKQRRGQLRIDHHVVKTEEVEQVSELEALALEMQGHGRQRTGDDVDRELDDGFWEELLMNNHKLDEEEDEDVNVLLN